MLCILSNQTSSSPSCDVRKRTSVVSGLRTTSRCRLGLPNNPVDTMVVPTLGVQLTTVTTRRIDGIHRRTLCIVCCAKVPRRTLVTNDCGTLEDKLLTLSAIRRSPWPETPFSTTGVIALQATAVIADTKEVLQSEHIADYPPIT